VPGWRRRRRCGTAGCRSLPRPGTYTEEPLATLAALRTSDNIFQRAIAVAAVNAHWNRYDIEASAANGLDLIENRGERTVVIGRFPGVVNPCWLGSRTRLPAPSPLGTVHAPFGAHGSSLC
jgi:hypothetical protein